MPGFGLTRAVWRKPGGDHRAAQLDEHVLEGRLGLGPVPGLGGAAVVDIGRGPYRAYQMTIRVCTSSVIGRAGPVSLGAGRTSEYGTALRGMRQVQVTFSGRVLSAGP